MRADFNRLVHGVGMRIKLCDGFEVGNTELPVRIVLSSRNGEVKYDRRRQKSRVGAPAWTGSSGSQEAARGRGCLNSEQAKSVGRGQGAGNTGQGKRTPDTNVTDTIPQVYQNA